MRKSLQKTSLKFDASRRPAAKRSAGRHVSAERARLHFIIDRQNELLRHQAIALEQAAALKSQFLANVSREVRTPLNAMLDYTSMLLQGVAGGVEPPVRRQLGRKSNGRQLRTIINEMLDLARIETGRMPLQLSTFTIPDLVTGVTTELEPMIKRSNLAVALRFSKNLRPISAIAGR